MTALGCVLLLVAAHVVRDGWPPTGSTFHARVIGTVLAIFGCIFVMPFLDALVFGLATGAGFWTDMMHGEGARARGWQDVQPLAISGVTSLAPIAITGVFYSPLALLVLLAGVVKPPIWWASWRLVYQPWWPWLNGTRVAAIAWGCLVGVVLIGAANL